MILATISNSALMSAAGAHLWQSTAGVLVAWLLTLTLRNYPARVRFWIWLFSSLKFLVPFALLTGLGAHWARQVHQPHAGAIFYTVIEQIDAPFATAHAGLPHPDAVRSAAVTPSIWAWIAGLWLCGCLVLLVRATLQWLEAGRLVRGGCVLQAGREVMALRSAEADAGIRKPIPIVITTRAVEPGIFGVILPVLLWPAGLSEQLEDAQIDAIMAHELEHVRRRDNLTFAIHRMVEALFWFHPATYWMGLKMREERERACDERVIAQERKPEKYAESILKVCMFCLDPPSACVAGVSGSNLKARILRIMNNRSATALTLGRRVVLGLAGVMVLALPIGFGIVRGQNGPAAPGTNSNPKDLPKFEVASIKTAASDDGMRMMSSFQFTPDGALLHGVPMQMVLRTAFGVEDDRIVGAPAWARSNRYDMEAKVAPEDASKLENLKLDERRAMFLPLLVERFNLKYHHETRELPMYALVVAKSGAKLTPSKSPPTPEPPDSPFGGRPVKGIDSLGRMMMRPGHVESQDATLDLLAHTLASQLGRSVVDKTGLTGRYDYTLDWTPDNPPPPMHVGQGFAAPPEGNGDAAQVSLSTALQEQLGLKLESQKGMVDVIVIDHIDLPSAN